MRLINDDCIHAMHELIDEGVKVDLILTDPPYGTTACKWDSIIPFDAMWGGVNGLCHRKTPVLLFGTEPFSSHLRLSNLKNFKYDWIWDKQIGTGIFTREYQPLNNYEIISVFYKKAKQYYPIMEKAKKDKSFKRNNIKSNTQGITLTTTTDYKDTGYRYPKRILTFNSQKGECNNINRVHPTQKPVALLEYLIKTYTKENDMVLDFTMGSGSTGVACKNTNRNFIGIELDKEYFKIAEKRINDTQTRLI